MSLWHGAEYGSTGRENFVQRTMIAYVQRQHERVSKSGQAAEPGARTQAESRRLCQTLTNAQMHMRTDASMQHADSVDQHTLEWLSPLNAKVFFFIYITFFLLDKTVCQGAAGFAASLQRRS